MFNSCQSQVSNKQLVRAWFRFMYGKLNNWPTPRFAQNGVVMAIKDASPLWKIIVSMDIWVKPVPSWTFKRTQMVWIQLQMVGEIR